MSDEARVHYFEGQFLRPEDFSDEQAYHLAAHRRHNIAGHRWGIVAGLALMLDPQDGRPVVQPGVAVDGFGRELVLTDRRPIGPQDFAAKGSDALDVYLSYARTGSEAPPSGYDGCDAGEPGAFYRWTERPYVEFQAADDPSADRRDPPGVLDGDRDFDPSRSPPDDPQRRWPVFLGTVVYDRADPQNPFSVDPVGRPYAGLVGGTVITPSGSATLQLGAERRGDTNRFALFVPDADSGPIPGQPRLAVADDGAVSVRGDTTLEGNLTIDEHALEFEVGAAHPVGAQPSQLYRVTDGGKDELRIEMAAPGAGGPEQVSIGTWIDGAFKPCLTVANDCTVTIHGDLVVEGAASPIAFPTPPPVVFAGGPQAPGGPQLFSLGQDTLLLAAAMAVAASAEQLPLFVEALRTHHPDVAERLRETLTERAP